MKITLSGYTIKAAKSGAVTLTKPKTVKANSIKRTGSGKLSFSYNQNDKADMNGYQVQYSYDKKFKATKTKYVKIAKALNKGKTAAVKTKTVKFSGLKKGKTYYVRVRAYRVYDGVTIYGKYSKTLKAKV
jgi:hypothetical protein